MNLKRFLLFTMALSIAYSSNAQEAPIVVDVKKITSTIQPTMWGVFFEDINMGADGGIYAELVKNRSFEFRTPMMGWSMKGKKHQEGDLLIINKGEENASNPRFLRVAADQDNKGDLGITNEGFRGMGIKTGLRYDFSVMYRQSTPGVSLRIELTDSTGNVVGSGPLVPAESGTVWKKQAVSFTATATVPKATMTLWFEGTGTIDLDIISLFPGDTWKNRPGGMRADMIQLLADMKPGFIRFPGGCIVEGYDLASRYQWKKTIGPVEERQLIINRWNNEFAHRPTPDYFQTFGLGFFEYFQLAEDIGAAPLPILNCGMACQFNSAEVVPVDELDPYVQDALDLIEFANGDVSTKWGKKRADMGHPAPFNLTMMGVGNENWGPQYLERLKVFTKAIKDKYPAFRIVNSAGTDSDGERFDLLNNELRARKADLIDEHYYRRPEWFLQNAGRYDSYDRNGPKIFAGEYAAQSDKTVSVKNRNNWLTALSEAAFMTGLERNAAVVHMASYAPLFAHVDGWQWTPDLIWVDNLQSYGSTDYYVQKLYSLNKGTHEVSIHQDNNFLNGKNDLFAAAAIDSSSKELIIKLVNASKSSKSSRVQVNGAKKLSGKAKSITLQSDDLEAINTPGNPAAVVPKEAEIPVSGKTINLTLQPYSFTIVRVPIF